MRVYKYIFMYDYTSFRAAVLRKLVLYVNKIPKWRPVTRNRNWFINKYFDNIVIISSHRSDKVGFFFNGRSNEHLIMLPLATLY